MIASLQNWFETLNAALDAEDLIETWQSNFAGIAYGENFRYDTEDRHISIFRNTDGRYERPVHYSLTY